MSPFWKVYSGGEYRAACKHVEDAAALVAVLGAGAQIRAEHRLVMWTEGSETQSAGESYDHVREVTETRLQAHRKAHRVRRAAAQKSATMHATIKAGAK